MDHAFLYVEGPDDKHSLIQLLIRRGVSYDVKPWREEYPELRDGGGDATLLEAMPTAIRTSVGKPVGFVFDADSNVNDRWAKIRPKLVAVGLSPPTSMPPGGFIEELAEYKTRVGVWVMPDNSNAGALEEFLASLRNDADPLIGVSDDCVDSAIKIGSGVKAANRAKAQIRVWLGLQDQPGLRYGEAVKAKYFGDASPAADAFLAWFKALFSVR